MENKFQLEYNPRVVENARKFLHRYWGDEGQLETIGEDMKDTLSYAPHLVVNGLKSLKSLLDMPLPEGFLLQIVTYDANNPLDELNDAGAKAWVEEMIEFIEQLLPSP